MMFSIMYHFQQSTTTKLWSIGLTKLTTLIQHDVVHKVNNHAHGIKPHIDDMGSTRASVV